MTEQFTIGLTGGIGSGKSAASNAFENLGVRVIDTDKISHFLTSANSDCLKTITDAFGSNILEKGQLNRAKLRKIIFGDDEARKKLENILHPRIRQHVEDARSEANGPYVIVVVPLLIETEAYQFINRVLVVDCDEQTQINRVKKRNNLDENEVRDIMRTQATRQKRLAAADDIIYNNGNLCLLLEQVQSFHEKYLDISSELNGIQK
ncbi:MAG: dephospho-CoA kinase [Burkholderiales bacterium]|nr:dephospho-CoA kinase [Burkholderiales bacterium]OUT76593.1 MAG: dephospho-CoA kinase [Betaproteobacteria bacterium TMED22]|tara:strand:+ start:34734 stop:35354 length:621 start_codon:yes stop_codon:yes gene_type:complete